MAQVYGLFQTDAWQSLDSYVCFGYFKSMLEAEDEAQANELLRWGTDGSYYSAEENTKVVIEEYTIGMFGERNGSTVREYEWAEDYGECEQCGNTVTDNNHTFNEDGATVYFCSEECKGDYIHSLKHDDNESTGIFTHIDSECQESIGYD